ncbi:ABC transporter permease subunit [Vibrio sp. PP-XX7]
MLFKLVSDGWGGVSLESRITGTVSIPDVLWHGVLPLIALSFHGSIRYFYLAYGLARQIRKRPFISYARIRGVKGIRLLWHWFLPNAMPEIVSRLSSSLPGMVSATMFIEVIFHIQAQEASC